MPHLKTAIAESLTEMEQQILQQHLLIEEWFDEQWRQRSPQFYCSVDIRNAGFKIAPVDTNLFPAGFNNLPLNLLPGCTEAVQATISELVPDVTHLLVIPEKHTRNMFYFENLVALQQILQQAGLVVRIGSLDETLSQPLKHQLPSGKTLILEPLVRHENRLGLADFNPECILLNNDLSSGIPPILQGLATKVVPSMHLGWQERTKIKHFKYYQKIAEELAEIIKIDPWMIAPWYTYCEGVDFLKQKSISCLIEKSEVLLEKLQKKYISMGIERKPFLVMKADQGTYGMAVMSITDIGVLQHLNHKQRTRMAYSKGKRPVHRVIIQEGVYTIESVGKQQAVAEPVIYLFGRQVIGGFYRYHANKGITDNLNTLGMQFQPMDLANDPRSYIYGVIARLAALAAAGE